MTDHEHKPYNQVNRHHDHSRNIVLFTGPSLKAVEFDTSLLESKCYYWHRTLSPQTELSTEQRSFPQFDDVAVALFTKWLVGETLHGPNEAHSAYHYLDLYVLARKFECEQLQNRVIDLIRAYYREHNMSASPARLEFICQNTTSSDPMHRFMVATTAYRALVEHSGSEIDPNGPMYGSEAMQALIERNWLLQEDLQQMTLHISRAGLPDPRRGIACAWHQHEITPVCPKELLQPWETEEE